MYKGKKSLFAGVLGAVQAACQHLYRWRSACLVERTEGKADKARLILALTVVNVKVKSDNSLSMAKKGVIK